MPNFDLEGISFELRKPTEVSLDDFRHLQAVKMRAFEQALPGLEDDEIDHLAGTAHFGDFVDLMRFPHLLISRGLARPNQEYYHPRLAIARQAGKPVGYLYAVSNVSGETPEIRNAKRRGLIKNYKSARLAVVDPDLQGRGILHGLGFVTFAHTLPGRPASGYIWPNLLPQMDELARSWLFEPTNADNPEYVYPFGEEDESRKVKQVRYQSSSALRSALAITRIAREQGMSLPAFYRATRLKGPLTRLFNFMLEHDEANVGR